jgi:hypothetical protein
LYLHEQTYKKIFFLQERSNPFKAWLCPMLKPMLVQEMQYVYQDEDQINHIYFLQAGECGFVLPKHENIKYINIPVGANFGIIDIIGSVLQLADGF